MSMAAISHYAWAVGAQHAAPLLAEVDDYLRTYGRAAAALAAAVIER